MPVDRRSFIPENLPATQIRQGYLARDQDVRIRLWLLPGFPLDAHPSVSDIHAATLTRKTSEGLVRLEEERRMDHLVALRGYEYSFGTIIKTRLIFVDPQRPDEKWEIDFYHGRHEGLVVAECEASLETIQSIRIPAFCGDEVTGVVKFSNRSLALR